MKKEHSAFSYVRPLADVIKTYLKLKDGSGGVGVIPQMGPLGLEPRISAASGQRPNQARRRALSNSLIFTRF